MIESAGDNRDLIGYVVPAALREDGLTGTTLPGGRYLWGWHWDTCLVWERASGEIVFQSHPTNSHEAHRATASLSCQAECMRRNLEQ